MGPLPDCSRRLACKEIPKPENQFLVIAWQVHFGKLWCCRENANTKKSMIFLLRHHRFWFLEEVTHVPHLGIVKVPPFQLCAVKVVVFCAVTSKDLSNQCCRVLTRRRLLTTKGTHILQKILVRLSRWLGSNLPLIKCT